jgi:hypothetical protein
MGFHGLLQGELYLFYKITIKRTDERRLEVVVMLFLLCAGHTVWDKERGDRIMWHQGMRKFKTDTQK